ncbi:MAG: hypoxanthine phosphoribosyltransferase [Scytolyngbya sp. HA4215-MV1]|jgi:hypoxanthine phosphoribosyltransferase|nr:hypoxanthine phosphoribosyltransferase [Scytolyngbya sp. HA4215-MV1]
MKENLVSLISKEEIVLAVNRLAQALDRDYADRTPVVVGVLKGSFIFLADLIRAMQTTIANVELIRLSSYGAATVSAGEATLLLGLKEDTVRGRDVILVEDIVDTGISTTAALQYLKRYQPASIKLCALLDKPARRRTPVTIDYLGFKVPDQFIVGYGIDFDEKYRQLPGIYALERSMKSDVSGSIRV